MQTWMLRSGVWTRVQYDSNMSGSAFHEDFTGSATAPYVVSRSATGTKIRMRDGYNFHFWPAAGRASWSPSVTSIVVMVKARLIGQGAQAGCVGLSVGGDYWRTLSGGTNTPTDVTGAAVGRFKRIDGQWRMFSMTITPEALASSPLTVPFAATEMR